MTGLADVYEGDVGRLQSRRRVRIGIGLLAGGTFLAFVSIVIATTNLVGSVDSFGSRRIAGLLGGLAAPAILGGVATVLPANPALRVASVIGASVTVLGVTMFWYAYPDHWAGYGDQLTPYVVGVYFLGVLVLVTCLFAGIVTLKRRNDPGGTVSLNVETETETRVVEVETDSPDPGAGSVGFLGSTPDGDVDTQTNRSASDQPTLRGDRTPTSDGGTTTDDLHPPSTTTDAEVIRPDSGTASDLTDRYCGNCAQFQYVRTNEGMVPYCGEFDEQMDDMDACEQWQPNS